MTNEPKVIPEWFADFYAGQAGDLTLEEHGACLYLFVLASYAKRGLPIEPARLARMLGAIGVDALERLRPTIDRFFEERGDRLVPREWVWREKKSTAGLLVRKRRMEDARRLGRHTDTEWLALVEEYEGRCLRCARSDRPLHKDHIVPVSRGGSDDISNIQPLCKPCNSAKGTKEENYIEVRRAEELDS